MKVEAGTHERMMALSTLSLTDWMCCISAEQEHGKKKLGQALDRNDRKQSNTQETTKSSKQRPSRKMPSERKAAVKMYTRLSLASDISVLYQLASRRSF
ncbi:MAG: hypothetical protein GX465_18800 [Acidobacteria bacterium]|nr:hypothetical protein [Acidobacteriota bacterium]